MLGKIRFTYLFVFIAIFISCNEVKLSDARRQYLNGEYFSAAESYRKIYRKTPRDERALRGILSYEMAQNYRKLNMAQRAVTAYASAIRYNYPDTLMYLRYAQQLHKNGQYLQAGKAYEDYLKMVPNSVLAKNGLEGVALAQSNSAHLSRYKVKRVETLNSRQSDFSPVLSADGETLYFTSSHDEASGDTISTITGLKNNDIFTSRKNKQGGWQEPKSIGSTINTEMDEGTASFTASGEFMYYTFCPEDANRPTTARVYVSKRTGAQWGAGGEVMLAMSDTVSVFAHPAVSSFGTELYFVSDMPGGYGGKDIWIAVIDGTAVLSVRNAGNEINTPGDEMFPSLRNDTTLYFSSDGHPGLGGLDIFKAVKRSETNRWHVDAMPFPVNSSADDFGITFEKQKENGFFSSNRNDAKGYDHIYSFAYPDLNIEVEGFAVDKEDQFIEGARISVIGDDGSQREFVTKKDGTYRFNAAKNVSYVFAASADGFLNLKQSLHTSPLEKDTLYYVDFEMIPYNKPVILENIFYDFDKATLRPESKEELDGLIKILQENPNISIELSAHTDRKGSDEYNQNLSLRRAQSVVHYLVSQGIDDKRLTAGGYGEIQPKTVTKNIAEKYNFLKEGDTLSEDFIEKLTPEQQEITDQINRRTEFKVTDRTFGLY